MRPELIAETHPETAPENIIKGDCWRISVLTESLLRLEYDPDGIFEDRATQSVWNRNFPKSSFRVINTDDSLEIITPRAHLIYDRNPFSASGCPYRLLAITARTTASGTTERISTIWEEQPARWMKQTGQSLWITEL